MLYPAPGQNCMIHMARERTQRSHLATVKSAFSEAGTGSFWSQQRDTNGHHSDRSSNLENLNSDDMIAGNSITASIGGTMRMLTLTVPGCSMKSRCLG